MTMRWLSVSCSELVIYQRKYTWGSMSNLEQQYEAQVFESRNIAHIYENWKIVDQCTKHAHTLYWGKKKAENQADSSNTLHSTPYTNKYAWNYSSIPGTSILKNFAQSSWHTWHSPKSYKYSAYHAYMLFYNWWMWNVRELKRLTNIFILLPAHPLQPRNLAQSTIGIESW